jgi:hypothetical protein
MISWFDKLTTNGIPEKLTTNGIEAKDDIGLFDKLTMNGRIRQAHHKR